MKQLLVFLILVNMPLYAMEKKLFPVPRAKDLNRVPYYLLSFLQEANDRSFEKKANVHIPEKEPVLPKYMELTSVLVFDNEAMPIHSLEYQELHKKFKDKQLVCKSEYEKNKQELYVQLNKLNNEQARIVSRQRHEINQQIESLNKQTVAIFNELARTHEAQEKQLSSKVQEILKSICKRLQAGVVLHKKTCVYVDSNSDITQDVYDQLNWEYIQEKKKQELALVQEPQK
jgi:Skp family chaperone for outer membrane proteins